jgi:hypothetical protein
MRLSEVYSIIGEPNYYDDGTILYSGHSNDRIDEAVTASIFDNDKLLAERMMRKIIIFIILIFILNMVICEIYLACNLKIEGFGIAGVKDVRIYGFDGEDYDYFEYSYYVKNNSKLMVELSKTNIKLDEKKVSANEIGVVTNDDLYVSPGENQHIFGVVAMSKDYGQNSDIASMSVWYIIREPVTGLPLGIGRISDKVVN